jgi:hypothetical protein
MNVGKLKGRDLEKALQVMGRCKLRECKSGVLLYSHI